MKDELGRRHCNKSGGAMSENAGVPQEPDWSCGSPLRGALVNARGLRTFYDVKEQCRAELGPFSEKALSIFFTVVLGMVAGRAREKGWERRSGGSVRKRADLYW